MGCVKNLWKTVHCEELTFKTQINPVVHQSSHLETVNKSREEFNVIAAPQFSMWGEITAGMKVCVPGVSVRRQRAAIFNWDEESLLPFSLSEGRTETFLTHVKINLKKKNENMQLSESRCFFSSRNLIHFKEDYPQSWFWPKKIEEVMF